MYAEQDQSGRQPPGSQEREVAATPYCGQFRPAIDEDLPPRLAELLAALGRKEVADGTRRSK